jgi:alpha-beta hydrolase superfamily lysophospholipase
MLVDLVQTTTRDGLRLDAAYQAPAAPAVRSGFDAFLFVHGTGGNFYGSTLFDALADRLLARGLAVLRVNTRGHDLTCNVAAGRGGRRLGAAYEVVDDCRHDLDAWLAWLKNKTGPRIGLLGHSLGAVKCLYAQANQPETPATCVVAISPPRLSYSWFVADREKANEFRETYQRASALVSAGEAAALIEVAVPMAMFITAAGYVEKYGPAERYNHLRFLDKVRCPVLLTLGESEAASNAAFRGVAEAVAQAAPAVRMEVVPGADHFYTGAREELMRRVEAWLAGVGG